MTATNPKKVLHMAAATGKAVRALGNSRSHDQDEGHDSGEQQEHDRGTERIEKASNERSAFSYQSSVNVKITPRARPISARISPSRRRPSLTFPPPPSLMLAPPHL